MTERLEKAIQRVLRSGAKLGAGDQELQSHYNALTELRRAAAQAPSAKAIEELRRDADKYRYDHRYDRYTSIGNGWTH